MDAKKKATHTPGPWEVGEEFEHVIGHRFDNGEWETVGWVRRAPAHGNEMANAQVLAAAPELLAALRDALAYLADHHGVDASAESVWKQGRAAIAAAEGRE